MATPLMSDSGTGFQRRWEINPVFYYIVGVGIVAFLIWYFAIRNFEGVVPATSINYDPKPNAVEVDLRSTPPPPPSQNP